MRVVSSEGVIVDWAGAWVDHIVGGGGVLEDLNITCSQRLPLHCVAMHGNVLSICERSLVGLMVLLRLVLELHIVDYRSISDILRVNLNLVNPYSCLVNILATLNVSRVVWLK